MNKKQQLVYTYCMNNPCLSEDIDYEDDDIRAKHYKEMVLSCSDDVLNRCIDDYGIKVEQ